MVLYASADQGPPIFHVADIVWGLFRDSLGKELFHCKASTLHITNTEKIQTHLQAPSCDSKTYLSAQALEDTTYCTLRRHWDWPTNCYALVKTQPQATMTTQSMHDKNYVISSISHLFHFGLDISQEPG